MQVRYIMCRCNISCAVYIYTHTLPRFVIEGSTFHAGNEHLHPGLECNGAMSFSMHMCTGNKVAGLSCKGAIPSGKYRC